MMSKPVWPTTKGLPITSKYGWRTHPISGQPQFHAGIDIGGGGVNHPIYATQSGYVFKKGYDNARGYYVDIKHTVDPYYSRYQHLAGPSSKNVGDFVTKGTQIGIMGNSGASTGIHLHFEIATSSTGWSTEAGTIDLEKYLEMDFDDGGSGGSGREIDDKFFISQRRKNIILRRR